MIEDCGIVIDLKVPPPQYNQHSHTQKKTEEQVSLMSRSEKENKENIYSVIFGTNWLCLYNHDSS